MRFMQMKTSTFLVREKGFDPKSLGVQATRLLGCVHIRDQIQGRFTSLCPTTDEQNRTILCTCKRTRLQGEWSRVERFSIKPGKVRVTTLKEASDGIDQDAKGRLAQQATGVAQR